jgi:glycosyltransferase involved in cell wall biosynthesis
LGLRGITFIYVGRLWWAKGLDYLVAAFHQLQRKGEMETSLLIVGDGQELARLQTACSDLGIQNVVFVGFREKDELPLLYAASDVSVFPTLGDTYGMVVDEAMACSLPIISTSAAGEIRERIEDGVNGFVVPPRDTPRMVGCMGLLARDSGLRQRMGEESYNRIRLHTPERWATDFEHAVDRILAMPPRAKSA